MRREKNPPKTTPPILRVKISSRVGHRRKSYERTKRQGGGRSGKLGGISQNFWIFSSSTFGVKIDHAKMMINAEEEISNKNFWVLSARARARARARTAPSPGGGRLRHLSTKRFKNVFGGRAAIFGFQIFFARTCMLGFVRFYSIFLSSPLLKHKKKSFQTPPPAFFFFPGMSDVLFFFACSLPPANKN